MSGRRMLVAVSAAVLSALAAACGSSSPSRSASTTAVRTYQGTGFELAIPAGWARVSSFSGATGASGAAFAAPNHRASIDVHFNPRPTESVAQALSDALLTDTVETQQGAIRVVQRYVQAASVPGARQAEELIETYVNPAGTQRYMDLVVLTPSGAQIDVEAVASARSSSFDPATAIASFRLVQRS